MARSLLLAGILVWLGWPAMAAGIRLQSVRAQRLFKEVTTDIAKRGAKIKIESKKNSIVISEDGFDVFERLRLWEFPKRSSTSDHEVVGLRWLDGRYVLDVYGRVHDEQHDLVDDGSGWFFVHKVKKFGVVSELDPREHGYLYKEKPKNLGLAYYYEAEAPELSPMVLFKNADRTARIVAGEPMVLGNNLLASLEPNVTVSTKGLTEPIFVLISPDGTPQMSPYLASDQLTDRGSAYEGVLKQKPDASKDRYAKPDATKWLSEGEQEKIELRVLIDKVNASHVSEPFTKFLGRVGDRYFLLQRNKEKFYVAIDDVTRHSRPFDTLLGTDALVGGLRGEYSRQLASGLDADAISPPFRGEPRDAGKSWLLEVESGLQLVRKGACGSASIPFKRILDEGRRTFDILFNDPTSLGRWLFVEKLDGTRVWLSTDDLSTRSEDDRPRAEERFRQ